MMSLRVLGLLGAGFVLATNVASANAPATPKAASSPTTAVPKVTFIEPANGAKVTSKFKVKMGVEGYKVVPAGDLTKNTGHHHLLIGQSPIASGQVIPTDDKHIHFGKGQTETEVELPPGKYKLTLQFADGAHRSYGPPMSATIDVEVVAGKAKP